MLRMIDTLASCEFSTRPPSDLYIGIIVSKYMLCIQIMHQNHYVVFFVSAAFVVVAPVPAGADSSLANPGMVP
jgi:hypothetical protein